MSKKSVLPAKVRRYYARHRELEHIVSGATVDAIVTRYAYREGLRRVVGPRGGKAYQTFYRDVYYSAATLEWYDVRRVEVAPHVWRCMYAPIKSATLHDVHQGQSVEQGVPVASISIEDGHAVRIVACGVELFNVSNPEHTLNTYEAAIHALGLDHKKRKSPSAA
jgi:hypothetical protein